MKTGKRIFAIVAAVMLLLVGATVAGALYMLDFALCPEMQSVEEAEKITRERHQAINPWLDSLKAGNALRDTFITAADGHRLHGLYAKAQQPTRKTAVIVHGYTDQAVEMLHIGYLYHHDLHFNILLPDLRHAGLTEGESVQMGWKDRKDVMEWISRTSSFFGDSLEIVVHGISMGAATTMMTAGEPLPDAVRCFVEDCGYTSVWEQFSSVLRKDFGLPDFPLLHVSSLFCDWKYGWNFKEASAVEQLRSCRLPMLFIHGDEDDYVPTWMVHELYAAKPQPKEIWITEGVGHARSYDLYPEEYTRKVKEFIGKYIR